MKVDSIFKNKFSHISELEGLILKKYPDDVNHRKIRGDIFEDFIYLYFNCFKELYNLKSIYRNKGKEIPSRYKSLYKILDDYGVDGLAITNDNKALAWQSKFIKDRSPPSYSDITKLYHQGRKCDYNYIIANSLNLTSSSIYYENPKHKQILYDKFIELEQDDWNKIYNLSNNKSIKKIFYKPNRFQTDIVNKVVKNFKENERGKLIAACGTGKTLMSIWINEKLNKTNKILYIVPSLMLMRQTLKKWMQQSKKKYKYVCVCSETNIIKKIKQEDDEFEIDDKQIDIPVLNPNDIKKVLRKTTENVAIFSTYQSLKSIQDALKNTNIQFDIIFFDEAHRTAGSKYNENFSLALNNKNINTKKRLFMTATQRFVTQRTKSIADLRGMHIFSMDDISLYGPVFAELSFGKAIQEGLISDYKILTAEITEDQIYEHVKDNKLLDLDKLKKDDEKGYISTAKKIAHQILLFQAVENFNIRKIISFHSKVDRAKSFIKSDKLEDNLSLENMYNFFEIKKDLFNYRFDHLNAKDHTAEQRTVVLDETFNHNELGVISNAKCLTEGIDVPVIDSIFFADPKKSLTDIVQACGRALRKTFNINTFKTSYFIVPIIIPKNIDLDDAIDEDNNSILYSLVQSLRDLDFRMEEWIDSINLKNSSGNTGGKYGPIDPGPIVVLPNNKIDIKKFKEKLILKIAEVNSLPSPVFRKKVSYGKGERKAPNVKWGPIGDYSTDSLKKLVLKTIKEFGPKQEIANKQDINWQHNAISHTLRVGLIESLSDNKFRLTKDGKSLIKNEYLFNNILKKNILKYSIKIDADKSFYPYKAIIKVIMKNNYINFEEFAFCLYNLKGDTDELVEEASERIGYFRKLNFKFNKKLSEKNKKIILSKLNNIFATDFRLQDIWATTTVRNKFIYFRNHLVDCNIAKSLQGSILLNEKDFKKTIN